MRVPRRAVVGRGTGGTDELAAVRHPRRPVLARASEGEPGRGSRSPRLAVRFPVRHRSRVTRPAPGFTARPRLACTGRWSAQVDREAGAMIPARYDYHRPASVAEAV